MSNFTSLELIRETLETQLFGSTAILGLFIVAFFIIILMVSRNYAEAVLLIPSPIIIALVSSGMLPQWVLVLVWMVAGFYLAILIFAFTRLFRQ